MGKSLKKIVDTLREELTNYNITDDTRFDTEYLIDKVHAMRLTLLRDEIQRGRIDEGFYQLLDCIEVKCEKAVCEVDGIEVTSEDVRYYADLPRLVEGIGWRNILYLGEPDMKKNYTRKSLSGFIANSGNFYTAGVNAYTIVNKKALLTNLSTKSIQWLTAVLLLYSPQDACNWDADEDYPVPDVFKLEMMIKRDIYSMLGIPQDNVNDGRDGTAITPGEQQKQKR